MVIQLLFFFLLVLNQKWFRGWILAPQLALFRRRTVVWLSLHACRWLIFRQLWRGIVVCKLRILHIATVNAANVGKVTAHDSHTAISVVLILVVLLSCSCFLDSNWRINFNLFCDLDWTFAHGASSQVAALTDGNHFFLSNYPPMIVVLLYRLTELLHFMNLCCYYFRLLNIYLV